MSIQYLVLFAAAVIGASLIPGPSTILAFTHGAAAGWLRAVWTALGNASASGLQAIAASAGLGAILASSGLAFLVLKYAGAAYLIYAGIRMWRTAAAPVALTAGDDAGRKARRLFAAGFSVGISNPKAIAFFTALFPQFLTPETAAAGPLAAMVCIVCLGSFSVALFYAVLGSWVRGLHLSQRAMARIGKSAGGMFIASGAALAVSR